MLRVAVIGGGPSGSCAAEILAKAGIETWLFERKLDNAKPCGGAIPLCMVEEFDLPDEIIDRKVRNMKMISPSNREVDIKLDPLGYDENAYIGMCRREVFDAFLRNRAADLGTTLINGLVQKIDTGADRQGPYTIHYADYSGGGPTGEQKTGCGSDHWCRWRQFPGGESHGCRGLQRGHRLPGTDQASC